MKLTTTEGFLVMAEDSKDRNRTPSKKLLDMLDPDGIHVEQFTQPHKVYVPSDTRHLDGEAISGTWRDKGIRSRRRHADGHDAIYNKDHKNGKDSGLEMRTVWFVKTIDSAQPVTVVVDCSARVFDSATMDEEEYDEFITSPEENPTPPKGWKLK